MNEDELADRTRYVCKAIFPFPILSLTFFGFFMNFMNFPLCRCDKSVTDGGNVVSGNSLWQTTGSLVTRLTLPDSEALCSRDKIRINAFLPLSRLTRSHYVYRVFKKTIRVLWDALYISKPRCAQLCLCCHNNAQIRAKVTDTFSNTLRAHLCFDYL